MAATTTSKRAVFQSIAEHPDIHWPYYRLPDTAYTAADLGALDHDIHRLASAWFKHDAHDDIEKFICWCPLHHLDFEPHDTHSSWHANGQPSDPHPEGEFGRGNYVTLKGSDLSIEANDRGYGVKVGAVAYDPEWFHIRTEHNDRLAGYCERITDPNDELRAGRGELRVGDEGTVRLHLSATESIDVYEPGDVGRYLGETSIYATALVAGDGIDAVTVEPGHEFHHQREVTTEARRVPAAGRQTG